MDMHAKVCAWTPKDNFIESVLSIHPCMSYGDQAGGIGFSQQAPLPHWLRNPNPLTYQGQFKMRYPPTFPASSPAIPQNIATINTITVFHNWGLGNSLKTQILLSMAWRAIPYLTIHKPWQAFFTLQSPLQKHGRLHAAVKVPPSAFLPLLLYNYDGCVPSAKRLSVHCPHLII